MESTRPNLTNLNGAIEKIENYLTEHPGPISYSPTQVNDLINYFLKSYGNLNLKDYQIYQELGIEDIINLYCDVPPEELVEKLLNSGEYKQMYVADLIPVYYGDKCEEIKKLISPEIKEYIKKLEANQKPNIQLEIEKKFNVNSESILISESEKQELDKLMETAEKTIIKDGILNELSEKEIISAETEKKLNEYPYQLKIRTYIMDKGGIVRIGVSYNEKTNKTNICINPYISYPLILNRQRKLLDDLTREQIYSMSDYASSTGQAYAMLSLLKFSRDNNITLMY